MSDSHERQRRESHEPRKRRVPYNPAMRDYAAPKDLAAFDPEKELGFPGEFPFTRGIQPTMYRGGQTMRQYALRQCRRVNARYRYLLSQRTA